MKQKFYSRRTQFHGCTPECLEKMMKCSVLLSLCLTPNVVKADAFSSAHDMVPQTKPSTDLSVADVYSVTQQSHLLKGVVKDAKGEPIIGANVVVKGSTNGVVTDLDGKYELRNVPSNAVVQISYIGYLTQEFKAGELSTLDVKLLEDTQKLDEVVVVGYGVQKKKDLTGAVAVLKLDDVKTSPVSSVDEMMQGKLSGVNVMPDNMPGGGVAVRIRGFSTVRNNDPLYIIDGVPVENGINFLNPNDIESMQVLKDASSASIYGARAANGVVIISTKKGKQGKMTVNFDAYTGFQEAAKSLRMLNAQQYGDMLWTAMTNDGKTPANDIYGNGTTAVIPSYLDKAQTIPSDDVDWVQEILRKAIVQSYNLSFSKADDTSSQLFSAGYFDQNGLMKYTGFRRLNGRFNSEWKLFNKHAIIGENISLSHDWGVGATNNSALSGMLYNAYKYMSIIPVYDNNGNFAGNPFGDIENPLGSLYRNKDNNEHNTRIMGNAYIQISPIDGLTFKSNFGTDYKNYNLRDYSPKFSEINVLQALSTLTNTNSGRFNWVFTNTLNYLKSFGLNDVNVLLGTESLRNRYEYFTATRKGFAFDDENFHYLNAGGTSDQTNTGSMEQYSMTSYFGKIDYSFNNRYLAAFTLRRDGSSRLGKNKWGNFPAVSLGWRISNEAFFHSNLISDLKLRFGWGQNGNSDIPAYSTIDSYSSNQDYSNYPMDGSQSSVYTGYTQTRTSNPNLKWETTTQTNLGLDLGLLNNELLLTVDLFNKDTKDLLYARPLVSTVGGTNATMWDNIGKMNNKGVEVEINYKKSLDKDFGINVGMNLSVIRNKMTELSNGVSYIGIPSTMLHSVNFDQEISRSAVGHPIASFYVYKADGLFQSQQEIDSYVNSSGEKLQPNAHPGDIRFVDMNGDGKIDGNDRSFVGSPHPDLTAGLTLGFNYKNFDFSAFFSGSFGNDVYNLTKYLGEFFNQSQYNKNSTILNAWTPTHTNTSVPRVTQDDPNNNIRPSSYYIENGSYVRLKNLKVGYQLPKNILSLLNVQNAYLYLQATNLFTITSYDGIDPEVGLQSYTSSSRNLDMGIDRGIYPLSRSYTFGVNVSF
jgi:TonB-linked SusC/RagA family outer membrane protein